MIRKIIDKKLLKAQGVFGIYPAHSVGDDIHVFTENTMPRTGEPAAIFYGLRQQAEKESGVGEGYACLSDFIAPRESDVADYIGGFAVSVGFGVDEMCAKFEKDMDDYSSIMCKAVADRLAEVSWLIIILTIPQSSRKT